MPRGLLPNRHQVSALCRETDSVLAGIAFGASSLERPKRYQAAHKFGRARSIDSCCCHDCGLAEAVLLGDCSQHRVLPRGQPNVADITDKEAVGLKTGAVEKIERG
jgi:hypothetical protein